MNREIYEFGEFRLNVAEHFLVRSDNNERVPLSEKAFETLCILVRNSGHLVSKNEFLNLVWANSFVEENNLNKCVHAIRRALGEKPGEQKFIETIKKHGFRFIAEVQLIQLEEAADTILQENGFQSKTKQNSFAESLPLVKLNETQKTDTILVPASWQREADGNEAVEQFSPPSTTPEVITDQIPELLLAAIKPNSDGKIAAKNQLPLTVFVLAAFLISTFALGYYFYAVKKASSTDGKKSIAVLPLKPINMANRDDIYDIGIADSLIYRLGSIKGLIVRPLSATRKYADINQDPLAAGREQQVDYILASNYQLADGKIRITSQLFNVANGQIEETYKSEKDAGDLFKMQDQIASELGNILLARFATTSSNSNTLRGTTNEEAYRLYLHGMSMLDRTFWQKAVEAFEKAVRLDPGYVNAWAGLAQGHLGIARAPLLNANNSEEYQKSSEAINKALSLDPNFSEAHTAQCEMKFQYEWDFAGAERACQRALEINPNSSVAHQTHARSLMQLGRRDEAIGEIKTAIDLDPTSFFNQRIYANTLYLSRRYDDAVDQYKRLMQMSEENDPTYQWLIRTLEMQGKEAEAFEWLMKSPSMQKKDGATIQLFKTAYQTSGWAGVLREREIESEGTNQYFFRRACWKARLGDKDKAFEYLEKAYQQRESIMTILQVEPILDSLRGDPRYDELLKRVGFK